MPPTPVPDPSSVNVGPAAPEPPESVGWPTSRPDHPGGSVPSPTTITEVKPASTLPDNLWLDTASPTSTVGAIETEAVPNGVQTAPSADRDAVSVVPRRSTFSHTGAAPASPDVCSVAPPVCKRRRKPTPLPPVTNTKACRAPGSVDSRIITPACENGSTLVNELTRAITVASPVIGRYRKLN